MSYFESNNDFFGYTGTINRKNYAINMTILVLLLIGLSFLNLQSFNDFIPIKFLLSILSFLVSFAQFVIFFSILSLVYRRLADICKSKSYKTAEIIRKLFILLFALPVIYVICIRMFLPNIPFLTNILDVSVYFILLPLCLIASIVISFIK